MLDEAFVVPPAPTTSPGVNATKQLELAGGAIVFHKPFSGVHVANAIAYGQTDETPPLHEAVSWRLAVALGPPWDEIVVPCVLRDYAGEGGSLSLRAIGWPRDTAPTLNPTWCLPAAFFDSLIAQQDRHDGNWRWDGERLTLIDHGYTFALPRAILNYSDFVAARHRRGAARLLTDKRDALDSSAERLRSAWNGEVPAARPRAGTRRQGTPDAPTRRGPASRRVLRCPLCVRRSVVAS